MRGMLGKRMEFLISIGVMCDMKGVVESSGEGLGVVGGEGPGCAKYASIDMKPMAIMIVDSRKISIANLQYAKESPKLLLLMITTTCRYICPKYHGLP